MEIVDQALNIVKWFNNHGRALGLLHKHQAWRYATVLRLILPVLTRWTSHYLSATRLLEIELAVRVLVLGSRAILVDSVGKKADAIRKANEVLDIVLDSSFWDGLRM